MKFYDIFSKKGTYVDEKPLIRIDHREKSSSVIAELLLKPVKLHFEQLPIADYIIRDIAIERKTVSDLKSSIINRRIFDQINNLKQYEKHLLILEGIIEEDVYSRGLHENAFRGFLLSLALEHGVHIIFTHDYKDTAKYLCILALKKDKSSPAPLRPKPLLISKHQQMQFILEGFPGIGPATAHKLLSRFKSLKEIFLASEEDLRSVIGKKTDAFVRILNS
ncbi:hypothetical protein FJZ18_01895 [Candidatus Pacearchaeota archaeon]|nr:hypothetical protein [Candidatus Pacearchaeota archaeon]